VSLSINTIRSADYGKHAARCGEYEPCLICGRPIKQIAKYVRVHEGGATIVTDEEADALNAAGRESADFGVQLIGPECVREHRAALAPYIRK
jgi:hypothetical protein